MAFCGIEGDGVIMDVSGLVSWASWHRDIVVVGRQGLIQGVKALATCTKATARGMCYRYRIARLM